MMDIASLSQICTEPHFRQPLPIKQSQPKEVSALGLPLPGSLLGPSAPFLRSSLCALVCLLCSLSDQTLRPLRTRTISYTTHCSKSLAQWQTHGRHAAIPWRKGLPYFTVTLYRTSIVWKILSALNPHNTPWGQFCCSLIADEETGQRGRHLPKVTQLFLGGSGPGVDKLWPVGQICFVNKVLLAHNHSDSFTYDLQLVLHCNGKGE